VRQASVGGASIIAILSFVWLADELLDCAELDCPEDDALRR
jgi:hypothetical protein